MQRPRTTLATLLLILTAATSVMAGEVLTVVADSTLAGTDGFVIHATQTDGSGSSVFLVEEAGMVRLFASREYGSQSWDIEATVQYICPLTPMSLGDSWSSFTTDEGDETVAEVTAAENLTTDAGTFQCYRVDIEKVSEPGVLVETMWFSWGVGFVRSQGYWNGYMDYRDELDNYFTIGGATGYLPLDIGNWWSYAEVAVPSESVSWGAVKAMHR